MLTLVLTVCLSTHPQVCREERAKLVAGALTQALAGSDYFLMRRESVERLNEAALIAQAIIEMQSEELLRLAVDGADVDPDLIGKMVTVQ